jgi:hypothetical protein
MIYASHPATPYALPLTIGAAAELVSHLAGASVRKDRGTGRPVLTGTLPDGARLEITGTPTELGWALGSTFRLSGKTLVRRDDIPPRD